jgi:regulator of protease activity HflC (stomatin/prohibitin superfamily)
LGATREVCDLEAVAQLLSSTIQTHVDRAGIEVIEAKIAHLAYAPEIASAIEKETKDLLRRIRRA